MPGIIEARKIVAFRKIEQLPAKKKERAHKLYVILDKIEWLTLAPFLFGMFAFIVPFLAAFMNVKLPDSEVTKLLYALGSITLFYAVGVFALKKIVFNPLRNNAVDQFRTILSSDHNYKNTLETIKQLDPYITRIIRKYIVQAA